MIDYCMPNNFLIDKHIKKSLAEDITNEDISTNSIYKNGENATIDLIAKDNGIIAGIDIFKRVFEIIDSNISFNIKKFDGDSVKKSDLILTITGDVKTILMGERVALNYLQHLSGIATTTNNIIKKLNDPNIKILDTRKTTPSMRIFEKYAVKIGGGYNHRYNLSDMIMLKDNHIAAAGSIKEAIKRARDYSPFIKKIEIETETLDMVKEAIENNVDIIMLDNMSIDDIKKAIKIIDKKAIIECSGNVDINNISRFKGLDINYISSGYITHSSKILDISMKNLKII
ncbi:carboxylating nicotinate-nucleotide diphosphorylase [Peptostreptococcus equinus]|uniref:nicotinate-nucleotide diphosphorylase (carboxylating) n=1 Tax=Peptostreptococcus equinus TaxID=3003601 RepID=A0ABY7JPQ1_9FIRM|nr:carboxylating nicotinate-nucleotide diphosphorylase [Peptostreptococcus sp. CBA3647]WAW15139.1 carboxylating nicotinate-nucleotide diphosphorylase [Peptostreptococcus sp. CBA3647]